MIMMISREVGLGFTRLYHGRGVIAKHNCKPTWMRLGVYAKLNEY